MTVDKVIAKIIWLTFFGPPCIVYVTLTEQLKITFSVYTSQLKSHNFIYYHLINLKCNVNTEAETKATMKLTK